MDREKFISTPCPVSVLVAQRRDFFIRFLRSNREKIHITKIIGRTNTQLSALIFGQELERTQIDTL